jgi:hypothetical protein
MRRRPTASAASSGGLRRAAALRSVRTARAPSPSVTRAGEMSRVTTSSGRNIIHHRAVTSARTQAMPIATSSG